MEENENSPFWKWTGITMVIGFVIFFSWGTLREITFNMNHRFTVATTVGFSTGGWVDYEFNVNGVTYKRSNRGLSLKSTGAKYFVKYYTLDPSYFSKIVSNEEVPECIGGPPADGWKEMPKCK